MGFIQCTECKCMRNHSHSQCLISFISSPIRVPGLTIQHTVLMTTHHKNFILKTFPIRSTNAKHNSHPIYLLHEFLLGRCQKAHNADNDDDDGGIICPCTGCVFSEIKLSFVLGTVRFDFSDSNSNPLMCPIRTSSFHNVPG